MNIYRTGHECRCPDCREIVDRGCREEDSQLVAICSRHGFPLLQNIAQPDPHPLTDIEKERFIADGGGLLIEETLPMKAVRMLRTLKEDVDMTWGTLGQELGYEGSNFLSNFIWKCENGRAKDDAAQGMIDKIVAYRRGLVGEVKESDEMPETQAPVEEPTRPAAPEESEGQDALYLEAKMLDARLLVEEALGLDFDEILALKPQVELLAVALRNGIPARVLIESEVKA